MSNPSDFRNQEKIILKYDISHDNAETSDCIIFTDEAHLQSQYPDHEYINRDNWNEHTVAIVLNSGANATLNSFKARIFISVDAQVWFHWVEMVDANITIVDLPASYIKIVRDDTTVGTIVSTILSKATALQ
jgi:hypothetical protein